jgi:hypothetical protein
MRWSRCGPVSRSRGQVLAPGYTSRDLIELHYKEQDLACSGRLVGEDFPLGSPSVLAADQTGRRFTRVPQLVVTREPEIWS